MASTRHTRHNCGQMIFSRFAPTYGSEPLGTDYRYTDIPFAQALPEMNALIAQLLANTQVAAAHLPCNRLAALLNEISTLAEKGESAFNQAMLDRKREVTNLATQIRIEHERVALALSGPDLFDAVVHILGKAEAARGLDMSALGPLDQEALAL